MKRVLFGVKGWWLILLLICIIPFRGFTQEGDYYVSNFVIEPDRIDNPFFSIEKSPEGLIYVSNRSGILKYDGHHWKRIPCPGAVYSMKRKDNILFVGGKFGYGYIEELNNGKTEFISLSDSIGNIENIFLVRRKNDLVYFLNGLELFVYSDSTYQLKGRIKSDSIQYTQLTEYKDQLYLINESGNSFLIEGTKSTGVNSPFPENTLPVFISTNKAGITLFGSLANDLYTDTSGSFERVQLKDDNYLNDNQITSGIWLSDSLLAIGTLKGGLAILKTNLWDIHQIVNSHTGLSDNEVLGLQVDLDQGLWVAQSNGLDRVAPFLPVSNFSHYPGLNGKVESIYPNDTTIFVSTSMGVFYLSEVKNYNEVVDLIQKKVKVEVPIEVSKRAARQAQLDKKDSEEKKGFFSFLKREKTQDVEAEKESNPGLLGRIFNSGTETILTQRDSTYTEKRVSRELESIRYMYTRMDGINTKCSIFQSYQNDLIVGGLAGVYLLKQDSVINISDVAMRDLLITKSGMMVAAGVNGVIYFYKKENGKWDQVDQLEELSDNVLDIFEDYESRLWLTGTDYVYQLTPLGQEININEYELDNPYSDRTVAIEAGTKLLFINPHGVYSLNELEGVIRRDTVVENYMGLARKYFDSHQEYVWVYNGSKWYRLGIQPGEKSPEVRLLNLLSELKYVTYHEGHDAFWVVNADNEIYRLVETEANLSSNYKLVLSDFEDLDAYSSKEKLEFQEREGNIRFEYFHPDYAGVLGIEYRYRLEGLEQDWSNWMHDNTIQFPYLPPGDYRLTVQSKDIFNQLNQSPTILFKVVPPYWQQPWFYALEVLLFSMLFIISVRLNRYSNARSLLLNRLLAFLTLILMVEFVQAIAEAKFAIENSPVVNFFIQVSVAAAILPLERILRKWLIREEITEKPQELTSEESSPST